MDDIESVLHELGLTRDVAQYICNLVSAMYFAEWRDRMSQVHDELDVAMYCVYYTIEWIKTHGVPPIVASTWTAYGLYRYTLPDGSYRGLEVHAMERHPDDPEDDMCVECGTYPDNSVSLSDDE